MAHGTDAMQHDKEWDATSSSGSSTSSDENLLPGNVEALKQQSIELRRKAVEELETKTFAGTEWKDLSRSAQKKFIQLRVERYLRKKRKQAAAKESAACDVKEDVIDKGATRNRLRKVDRAHVREAMLQGPRVVIDCSMEDLMSPKEIHKLVSQIRGSYSINIRAEKPLHLHLSGLSEHCKIYSDCLQSCPGFDRYLIERSPLPYYQLFPVQELVYLSPDSSTVLTSLEPGKVYIVGGLVDESFHKGLTQSRASKLGVATAKLPICEFMDGGTHHQGCVLTINQVIAIMLGIHTGKGWSEVLSEHVPKRKGFVLKSGFTSDSSSDEECPQVDSVL